MAAYELATKITTPLALSALMILVFSAVIIVLVRRGGNARQILLFKSIAIYCFLLSIILGIMSISIEIIKIAIPGEVYVTGVVQDEDGDGLPYVKVSIVGGPSQETVDDGSFRIPISASKINRNYTITFFDKEYLSQKIEVYPNDIGPFLMQLKRVSEDRSIIDYILNVRISHWIGVPFVVIDLKMSNKNDFYISLKSLSVKMDPPDQKGYQFNYPFEFFSNPPAENGQLRLRSNSSALVTASFFNSNDEFNIYNIRLQKEYLENPQTPDPSVLVERVREVLVADLQKSAVRNFSWISGIWKIKILATFEKFSDEKIFEYKISERDIVKMKSNISDYKYGYGIFGNMRFMSREYGSSLVDLQAH